MKKVMLMLSVACIVAAAQASSFKWSATSIYNGSGSQSTMESGVAYIFCVNDIAQNDLFEAVKQDGLSALTDKAASSMAVSGGKIAVGSSLFEYGKSGTTYDFYFAILDTAHNQIYFSNIKEKQVAKVSPQVTSVIFSRQGSGSDAFATSEGFQGAGAWSAVPEPTSAMLLVLGVAALALRRKRA